MSNYKINNHGENETKHDHLIFITAKEKSATAETKRSQPKELIRLKSKFLTAKAKLVASSFGQRPSKYVVHDTAEHVHVIDFRISFCLPVTVFYERASE